MFAQTLPQHATIVRQVIAADQRQWCQSGIVPRDDRLGKIVVDGAWVRAGHGSACLCILRIPLFSHGQRYDPRLGRGECRAYARRRFGRDDHVSHGLDQPYSRAACLPLRHGVQAALRGDLVAHLLRTQRHARNCPVAIARRHRQIGIGRLMRAVECTDAQMNDARTLLLAIIVTARHGGRQPIGGFGGQPHSRYARRTSPLVNSCARSAASQSCRRCSATRRARKAQSTRRATSWRAGMERKARVSSLKPTVL